MQLRNLWAPMGLAALLAAPGTLGAQVAVVAEAPQAPAPDAVVTGISSTSSAREASITFFLSDGGTRVVALRDGAVLIDGERRASYAPGSDVEREFRRFVSWTGQLGPNEAVAAARDWSVEGTFGGEEQAALQTIWNAFGELSAAEGVTPPIPPDVVASAGESMIEAEAAMALAREEMRRARDEIRVAIRDNIRNGVRSSIQIRGSDVAPRHVAPFAGVATGFAGLGGAFLALVAITFGVSAFAGRQIDVMADTVSASFGRSFFVGLFAQPLILPAFIATLVGLALTVVGILVIPFAIVAFAALLAASVLGGYLAVARVAGSAWMKRARGPRAGAIGLVQSTAWGLAIVLGVWLPAVLLGWIPAVGDALAWLAIVATWALATTGFGAAVLTRGGVRTTFGRKFRAPELPAATLFEEPGPEISTGEWLSGRAK